MLTIDKKFGKYANPEVERKFLLAEVPDGAIPYSEIVDLYITNTTLRLRKSKTEHEIQYKLAQKLRVNPDNTRVILHTNIYLSETEYLLLATTLPSKQLQKRRLSFQIGETSMWIDQFEGQLESLVIGEVDFGATGEPSSLATPSFAIKEITDDERFTGARLTSINRSQLTTLLNEFDLNLSGKV